MKLRPLSLALVLLTSTQVFAFGKARNPESGSERADLHTQAECGDVDPLAGKSPELQEFFRVPRDQGAFGDCYAEASADLATFASGIPISALDLNFLYEGAVSHNFLRRIFEGRRSKEEVLDGGTESGALSVGLKRGFCPESIIPSKGGAILGLLDLSQPIPPDTISELLPLIFPTLSSDQVDRDTWNLVQRNINEGLRALTLEACPSNRRTDISSLYSVVWHEISATDETRDGLIQTLDSVLTEYKTLSSIGVHATYLFSPERAEELGVNSHNDRHALIIQGRHWSGGQCWYTARNSWGDDCSPYNLNPNSLTCDPDTGIVQISESLLRNMIYDLTFLKKK